MSTAFLGEVRAMPFGFVPNGWMACQGQELPVAQYTGLYSLLLTTFGGNGSSTFGLPTLAPLAAETGTLQYCIAIQGVYPARPEPDAVAACAPEAVPTTAPFTGETRNFAFGFAPSGWLPCQGQLVPAAELADLFKAIGTTFGGDGSTSFALPNVAPLESADGAPLGLCISLFGDDPADG
ncbi:MAG TPA: tail fiber protein [Allosphingosinicella sp.]|nr:tail fiber protein [Allosphingosinicella sp.]